MSEELLPPVPHIYPAGCAFATPADIAGKKITVMGLGLNGGGEACVRYLLRQGAYVLVTDMKSPEALAPTIRSLSEDSTLDKGRLTYVLGQHRIEDFSSADVVIKNPGVKYAGNPYLAAAKAIETDISLFLHFTRAPIIAVTGSKGKSSTVSAIHYGLCAAGFKAFVGGNITVSPLTFLDETDGTTPVVLELSSWQLADLHGRQALRPHIAIITKIIPDHQNFYHSMLAYVADKKLIYADQTKNDFTILDADDDPSADGGTLIENWGNIFAAETPGTVLRYSTRRLPAGTWGVWQEKDGTGTARLPEKQLSRYARTHGKQTDTILRDLVVPGKHTRMNVLNAALVMELLGVAPEQTISILSKWNGIEHRLEFFHEWQYAVPETQQTISVRFFNDSCATVPEAAAAASQAFGTPVIFLTGGTDKGLDLTPLAETLSATSVHDISPESIYLLAGTATDKLMPALSNRMIPWNGPYDSLDALLESLKTALITAVQTRQRTGPATVVFSPGATSFGMFANEFDRGNQYKDKVKKLFT
jgi:UDP-N-acetylmuramoylalanine--D-glutamate ligase